MTPLASDLLPLPGQMRREDHLKSASGHSFTEVSRGRKEFHVDKITAGERSATRFCGDKVVPRPAGCTPGVVLTKLAGKQRTVCQAAQVYDLYRHLKLTAYRAIIRKDAPFPSEKHARNWRKIGTIETVSPEAKRHIDQKGFCIYVFTPALSFDEIEGSNEDT